MIASALLLLPFAANAAVTPLAARQFQMPDLAAMTGGAAHAAKSIQKLKPILDPTATREAVTWGPFEMQPPGGQHIPGPLKLDANSDLFYNQLGGICNDCTVLGSQTYIKLENGSVAGTSSGIYPHHVMMLDFGRPMIMGPTLMGPGGPATGANVSMPAVPKELEGGLKELTKGLGGFGMSIFVGQGSEGGGTGTGQLYSAPGTTVKSGFYIQPKDQITLLAELVNYNTVKTNIMVTLEYEYIKGKPPGTLDVGQYGIGITANPLGGFTPSKTESVTMTSPDYPVVNAGYLLNITPHLHDGGINLKLYRNNQLVCDSKAIYGGGLNSADVNGQWETITAYSPCVDPIEVKKGDVLKLTTEYDLTKHRLRPDSANHDMEAEGMAIATYIFAIKPNGA